MYTDHGLAFAGPEYRASLATAPNVVLGVIIDAAAGYIQDSQS
jgi:hypothetical protein